MVARGAAGVGSRVRAPAVLLTLVIGIVALAGPAIRRQDQSRLRNLDATVIVVDASQTMADGGQLRDAASVAHDVLDHLSARQAALIVYAGDAYVASALTDFTNAIETDLFALDEETVPDPACGRTARWRLPARCWTKRTSSTGDVILITSGGGLDGTDGDPRRGRLGRGGPARLRDGGVGQRRAAHRGGDRRGGGRGRRDSLSTCAPERGCSTPCQAKVHRSHGQQRHQRLTWRDLGRLLLVFAAMPLLLGFRKAAAA